jgi:Domain of unknown function (DUF4288)
MNWYLTKIIFRIICGDGHHRAQFDEQLRLIQAEDENEAYAKATEIGLREQDEFFNQQRKLVQWKFINIAELYKLSGLLDGAELYSTIQETDSADLYIDLVNKKASHIRLNSTHKFLEIL